MKLKLEVDDELADQIVSAALKEAIELLEIHISELQRKKKRQRYENEDLANAVIDLCALKKTYAYFGGNLK